MYKYNNITKLNVKIEVFVWLTVNCLLQTHHYVNNFVQARSINFL